MEAPEVLAELARLELKEPKEIQEVWGQQVQ
jgi:hypothetical protein